MTDRVEVVAERALVMVAVLSPGAAAAAAALPVVPLAVAGVTIGGTVDESVDLLGRAAAGGGGASCLPMLLCAEWKPAEGLRRRARRRD